MKPNESVSLDPAPGVPTSADPVEILAYSLWNDGHKDEAIAVLERQIALEKKLAEGGSVSPTPAHAPPNLPNVDAFKLPVVTARSDATQNRAELGPAASTIGGRALRVVSAIPKAPAAVNDPRPGIVDRSADWNERRPGRGLVWLFGLLLIVAGAIGLWARTDRGTTEVAQPVSQEAPSGEPPAQPAEAVAPATERAAPPVTETEPELEAVEPPVEEALDIPPAEDDTAAPAPEVAATPRPRPEPEQPARAAREAVDPPPEEPVAAPAERAPAQPSTARRRPAEDDARAARARRLAERREAAERYVARRRAEAERRAAQRRGAAAPPRAPTREGPSILLGGRGLPD